MQNTIDTTKDVCMRLYFIHYHMRVREREWLKRRRRGILDNMLLGEEEEEIWTSFQGGDGGDWLMYDYSADWHAPLAGSSQSVCDKVAAIDE